MLESLGANVEVCYVTGENYDMICPQHPLGSSSVMHLFFPFFCVKLASMIFLFFTDETSFHDPTPAIIRVCSATRETRETRDTREKMKKKPA